MLDTDNTYSGRWRWTINWRYVCCLQPPKVTKTSIAENFSIGCPVNSIQQAKWCSIDPRMTSWRLQAIRSSILLSSLHRQLRRTHHSLTWLNTSIHTWRSNCHIRSLSRLICSLFSTRVQNAIGNHVQGFQRKPSKPDTYKTVMCQAWLESLKCTFGENCKFAWVWHWCPCRGTHFSDTENKSCDRQSKFSHCVVVESEDVFK